MVEDGAPARRLRTGSVVAVAAAVALTAVAIADRGSGERWCGDLAAAAGLHERRTAAQTWDDISVLQDDLQERMTARHVYEKSCGLAAHYDTEPAILVECERDWIDWEAAQRGGDPGDKGEYFENCIRREEFMATIPDDDLRPGEPVPTMPTEEEDGR